MYNIDANIPLLPIVRNRNTSFWKVNKEEITKQWISGVSTKKIADSLKATCAKVQYAVRKLELPKRVNRSGPRYPWVSMKPGNSFFVPNVKHVSYKNGKVAHGTASKWATRAVTENNVKGIRVWRVA